MANEYFMKRCTTTSIIRKMHSRLQRETQLRESDMTKHTHAHVTPRNPVKTTSPLLYCWWECTRMQGLSNLIDRCTNDEIRQSHDPAPQLLGIRTFHEYIFRTCVNSQQSFLQSLLLLLLLSHFGCVRLCATPQMAVHQAPLSLGFSRQEYWSGLPFPPPVHESER